MVGDGSERLLAKAFAARRAEPDSRALTDLVDDYAANATVATRLFPGVREALEHLSGAGWLLAVCTNKLTAPARTVLDALDVLPMFAAVSGADSVPARKPDPAHLRATLRAAGGVPERAVMLGDHANDINAALAASIPAIFAGWGYGPPAMAGGAAAVAHQAAEVPVLAACLVGLTPPGR